MNRILVATVNWLGDAIMMTPVFRAIKEKIPSCYTGVMAVKRVQDVFKNNPYIDKIISFDEKSSERSLGAKINFIKSLKRENFDTVFLIHRSFTRAFICTLAGIENRIGYKRFKNSLVLTEKIEPQATALHRQDYYLYLFEKSGINIADKLPEFFIPGNIKETISPLLQQINQGKSYVVGINPCGNWNIKRWPHYMFAELADKLITSLNCTIVFTGTDKDFGYVETVIEKMKEKPVNLCGKTGLAELAALMEKMDLFISNDSGPAHLSAALGKNTLVIFGPTSAQITAPRGKSVKVVKSHVDCPIPCYNISCENNVCMKKITPEEVFNQAKKMLINERD